MQSHWEAVMQKRSKILIAAIALLMIATVSYSIFFFGFHLPKKKLEADRARQVLEYYQSKLTLYKAENERFADYEVDVAFLGDSLTDGYDLLKYYPQYLTANRGIGGETTHGLASRMQISLYDLRPKVAVLLIGGNNLDTMLENYEALLVGMRDNLPETKVVLVSLTSMGGDWAHKNQLAAYNNAIIKRLAQKYAFAFVDLYTPLLDEVIGELRAEYTTDGAHLTPLGYEVFTDTLTPVLDNLLQSVKE